MKAGAALGLLAGLGAINALRGGREGTGKRFTGLLDMLDGGGAGASGDRFEGGGLLSMLGNLFAKPLEAQDNVERIAADTNATKAVTKTLEDIAKGGTLTSRLDGKDGLLSPAQKEQIVMDQVVNPDVYRIGQGGEFAGSMLAKELTGSADMPPELLPMTTPRGALDTLFDRSVEQGYEGVDMPSYRAEKRIINMAGFPDSEYSYPDKINYASLMPPSLTSEPSNEAPDFPLPRAGNQAGYLRTHGAEFYNQPDIAPDYAGDYTRRQDGVARTPYPSAMSPAAPSMPQGIMSFRDFVDAERAAMSGSDLYVDPANYRRGYARYLRSMGVDPAMMGM